MASKVPIFGAEVPLVLPPMHAGRILNRFSRDMDIMDATLPPTLIQLFGALATYIAILSECLAWIIKRI